MSVVKMLVLRSEFISDLKEWRSRKVFGVSSSLYDSLKKYPLPVDPCNNFEFASWYIIIWDTHASFCIATVVPAAYSILNCFHISTRIDTFYFFLPDRIWILVLAMAGWKKIEDTTKNPIISETLFFKEALKDFFASFHLTGAVPNYFVVSSYFRLGRPIPTLEEYEPTTRAEVYPC